MQKRIYEEPEPTHGNLRAGNNFKLCVCLDSQAWEPDELLVQFHIATGLELGGNVFSYTTPICVLKTIPNPSRW